MPFNPDQNNFIERLREKWREIPATRSERMVSSDLLVWSDTELLAYWEKCCQETAIPRVRGWYQEFYKDSFRDAEMLDIGPGLGLDGIFFAEHGAHVTFADIVDENLRLLERICRLKGIKAEYYFIKDPRDFVLPRSFDVILAIGSLINVPFDFARREIGFVTKCLKPGGRILFLGYPHERFLASGAKNGAEFGKATDGERTPWVEWYDALKIKELFGDEFVLNWSCNFSNHEFNWFELEKRGSASVSGTGAVFAVPRVLQVPAVDSYHLHERLHFTDGFHPPDDCGKADLADWNMERDDVPVLRYLFSNFKPKRHLEFGTWKGAGTKLVLEACDAHVWTINLWEGEVMADGSPGYGRTDSKGMIGLAYRDASLGHRVDQIYSDSRLWDDKTYPDGFFDSVFIDGGHDAETVRADLYKALRLLRPGGLLLLHDFCPRPEVNAVCPSTVGVTSVVGSELSRLQEICECLFWIKPSWILCAIKRRKITSEQAAQENAWFDEARKAGITSARESSRKQKELQQSPTKEAIDPTILDIKEKRLAHYWEFNLSSQTGVDPDYFAARSIKDYIATNFFPVPSPIANSQNLRLQFTFGASDASTRFNCSIQSRDYTEFIKFSCEADANHEWKTEVCLPGDPAEVRLVLFPHDLTPHSLPASLRIESDAATHESMARLKMARDVAVLREQRNQLLSSRWRKIGRKLGIIKPLPFEKE